MKTPKKAMPLPPHEMADDPELLELGILDQLEDLSARIEEIRQVMAARLSALRVSRARMVQRDPVWLSELRSQYNEEVSRRTLQVNEEFPIVRG